MNDLAERIARLTDAQRRLLATRLGLTEPAPESEKDDAVAIIGMGCRLPGGITSPESFWEALCAGRDLISETPTDRWAADEWFDEDPATPGTTNSRWGGYLDDIAGFDRRYFRISADEAARMDPQQRLLLETAFAALTDAGLPAASLAGTDTGVYMASMTDDYTWLQAVDPELVTVHTGTGTQRSILANRLSYELDLRGPSIAMDTACSSSLAAVHLACQSIRAGESEVALAGGVNVMASPVTTVIYAKLGMLAPDGRCKTFDAAADGFVRAEGAGVVVLKRLSAALRDGDPIWAVVRGTAIGQDGRTSSITAPSGPAQTAVIRRALARAGVAPEEVGLVETHGTGTALGDPLELEALATALAGGGCLLGAVKTNLGHLEAAAGVVGVIKTALSLHHRLVPPVLHQRQRNPRIDLAGFTIPTVPAPLPDGVAGVSSFGFGGALAHAVLAPAPPVSVALASAAPRLVVVTARAEAALTSLADAYADSLGEVTLADLAHTTLRRRDLHPFRAVVVADTEADAAVALRAVTPVRAFDEPEVAFVFPGQGALAPGTAKELYDGDPVFRAAADECDAEFRAAMDWSPIEATEFTDTRHAQAALFTVQVGLAAVWRSWGLRPAAVVGQSLGEVAAAYVAGALDLTDAVRVVVARGALMTRLEGHGASAVVELPAASAAGLGLAVAGVLSPTTTLLSGPPSVVRRAVEDLAADGVFTHELRDVRVAFHSPETAALAPELAAALSGITPRSPQIPFVSTVTGSAESHLDGSYWARNLAEPFDLPSALPDVRCFVEVSAHPALRRAITGSTSDSVVVGSLTRGEPDRRALLAAAGTLLTAGVTLDPTALAPDGRPARLPGYPWQHEEAWLPTRPFRRDADPSPQPQPQPDPAPEPAAAAPDELEEVLRELWADALAVEPELIASDTNFFQLGGNSLKGFGLVRQISERLDVRIPMDQVADLLTIRELADHIRTLRTPAPEPLAAADPGLEATDPATFAADAAPDDLAAEGLGLEAAGPADAAAPDGPVVDEPGLEAAGSTAVAPEALTAGAIEEATLQASEAIDPETSTSGVTDDVAPESLAAEGSEREAAGSEGFVAGASGDAGPDGLAAEGLEPEPGVLEASAAGASEDVGAGGLAADGSGLEAAGSEATASEASAADATDDGGPEGLAAEGFGPEAAGSEAVGLEASAAGASEDVGAGGLAAEGFGLEAAGSEGFVAGASEDAGAGGLAAEGFGPEAVGLEAPAAGASEDAGADGLAADGFGPEPRGLEAFASGVAEDAAPDGLVTGGSGLEAAGSEAPTAGAIEEATLQALAAVAPGPEATVSEAIDSETFASGVAAVAPGPEDTGSEAFAAGGIEDAGPEAADAVVGPAEALVSEAAVLDDAPPAAGDRFEPFPLLPIQRAYWVGQSMALGGVPARHYLEYQTDGVDLERLEAAWNRLIRRHEMLRAVVDPDGRQRILPDVPYYRIERTEISDGATLTALRERLADPGRGTAEWPLFDVHATRFPDGSIRVHLAVDMVACDGRSFGILSDEWQLLHREPAAELPELGLSFRDVVLDYQNADRSEANAYWRPRLADLPPPPQLPWALDPDALGRPTFRRRTARLDRDRWQRLRDRTAEAGISPSALLLAAYAEVLGTWSANPEFCVNVTTFTLRTVHPAGNSIVGDFTSNVPVAIDTTSAPGLRERAKAVQRRLWSDVQHIGRSGVELVAEAGALRGDDAFRLGVPYVFTSLLTNDDRGEPPVPFGWFGQRVHSVALTPQVLVDLQVMADRGELVMDVDTIDEMFPPGLTDALVDALVGLLTELADDPAAWERPPLSLVPSKQLTARRSANRTDAPVPAGGLHEPFVRAAREQPDRVAVRTNSRTLTYGELDRASEYVADRLTDAGIGRGHLVAITMRKGWEQVVAVLGVLKAGAAYVPVDPDLPVARRRHLLDRTGAAAVLTQVGLPDDGPTAFVIDGVGTDLRERPGPGGDDVAYVIFTSGSTGDPKGVVIHHRAALNTVLDLNARLNVGPRDAVLALSSLSFDLSVYDVFGVLAAGATIVLPDADHAHDPEHWADLVTTHGVTVWNSVPALYGMYVDHLTRAGGPAPGLRDVLLSGDWISLTLPERSRAVAPDAALTSLGGATEAAIWSICHPIGEPDPAWPSIPYGRPLTNQRFHVVNAAGAHCPDWVPGELRIAGVGVALGYLGDEERTRASFPVDRRTGERQYRTGDLGRYRPDGTIEFLGRTDSQVKVQGHRIELGEIEAALTSVPGIGAAAVVVLGARDANRTLAAHVVADGLTARDVRAHLAARLPGYMVPPTTTFWPALPLTGNGKVDRARLVAAGASENPTEDAPRAEPTTPVEQALAAIWCAVLDRERIGVHDRFFELGGDSVLSVQVVSRAARAGIRITPRDLFEHQTVAELAAAARVDGPSRAAPPLEGTVPLLPIQRWLLELGLAEPARFTQTLLLEPVDGPLDPDRLAAAVTTAFGRHDALRLRFNRATVTWTQYYVAEPGVVVEQVPDTDRHAVAGRVTAALDLTDGPLARAVVFVTDDAATALLVTAHHLVVDGVSWQVLLDDVAAAYAGEPLPPVETGFGAYAAALVDHADRPELAANAAAWADRLAGVTPASPAGPESEAVTIARSLDETVTADLLTRAGAAYRTGVDDLLLTALARTLRAPGGGPLRVDVEGHGRAIPGLPDVSGTVGWFTTVTPVALALDPALDHGDAIVAVKESVRVLPGGAEVLHADWPRAQIVLNYLGRLDGLGGGLLRIANGEAGRVSAPDNRRPWALEIDCRVLAGRFHVTWTYDSHRHSPAAEAMLDRFVAELDALVRHCVTPSAGRHTPSDFPLAALTDEALATVLDQFRRANAHQDEETRS